MPENTEDEVEVPIAMQGQKYLHFVVDENGDATCTAHNFSGSACVEASRAFEEALGTVSEREEFGHATEQQRIKH